MLPNEWFETSVSQSEFAGICKRAGVKHLALSLITGRCGSTYLAEVTSACGFGLGHELFSEDEYQPADTYRKDDVASYLFDKLRHGRVGDTLYFQMSIWRYQALRNLLPFDVVSPADVTLIFRRDLLSQAISFATASSTGIWHSNESPRYIRDDIAPEADPLHWVESLRAAELACREAAPSAPIFFYEDIVASPAVTASAFLAHYRREITPARLEHALRQPGLTKKLINPGYFQQLDQLRKKLPEYDQLAARLATRHIGASPTSEGVSLSQPASVTAVDAQNLSRTTDVPVEAP